MARVREDIHIHAARDDVFERLARFERAPEWLPPAFRDPHGDGDSLTFRLALPLYTEAARLVVRELEAPAFLALTSRRSGSNGAASRPPALDGVSWALHQESARSVHLTVEAEYTPAPGLVGALLEPVLHAPLRRQAFRDALWRLKQLAEGRGPAAS